MKASPTTYDPTCATDLLNESTFRDVLPYVGIIALLGVGYYLYTRSQKKRG